MESHDELARRASIGDVILHYIASVLGIGLIISPALSFYLSGNQALYTWILLAAVSIPISFIFVWLALRYGASSSISLFVDDALGALPAAFVSYCLIFTMFIGNPIMSLTSATYIVNIFLMPDYGIIPIAIVLMMFSLLCVSLDIKKFFNLQRALTFFFIIIFVGGSLFSIYSNRVDVFKLPALNESSLDAIFATFFVCFLAFTGWENGITIVEEIKKSRNVLYIGAISSCIILLFIYLLSFYANQPYVDRAGAEDQSINAVQSLFASLFGDVGALTIGILVPVILFLSTNAWLYGTSRLIYSLSKKNFLPTFLWKRASGGNIPKSLLLLMFVAYSMTFFMYVFFSLNIHDLVFLYSFGSYIVFLLVFLSGVLTFKSWKKLTALGVFILFAILLFKLEFKIELAGLFIIICFLTALFSRKGNQVYD